MPASTPAGIHPRELHTCPLLSLEQSLQDVCTALLCSCGVCTLLSGPSWPAVWSRTLPSPPASLCAHQIVQTCPHQRGFPGAAGTKRVSLLRLPPIHQGTATQRDSDTSALVPRMSSDEDFSFESSTGVQMVRIWFCHCQGPGSVLVRELRFCKPLDQNKSNNNKKYVPFVTRLIPTDPSGRMADNVTLSIMSSGMHLWPVMLPLKGAQWPSSLQCFCGLSLTPRRSELGSGTSSSRNGDGGATESPIRSLPTGG